ncbi:hypothetical protein BC832DRAFT_328214 [Gaertneriomyces semiglobifer]|nr:hypothetical protein BC832DRAFT_328214 [Gaertneriomyces semiglobifer]
MDGLKATIHDREVRISELKILLNERSTELSNMKLLLQTQEQQHIDIVRKVQRESEATAQRYDDQLLEQREALETQRTSFLLQIKTLEQDIQIQRDGFTEELQRAKRSQQVEMQLYKQELNQKLLQADQKIATAHAELNVVKSARNDLESKLQQQMDTNKSLTKQLRDLQWETADSAKIATTRIVELEEALRQSQEQAASDFEVYEENRRRVQSQLEESNQCLEREKSSAKQQIQSLLTELASTNAQLREASEQHKNEVSTLMRTVNEKQEQLEHLHKELNEGQGSTQELIGKCAAEILVRDRQLEKQTATIHELQEELKVLVADVDTYRRDIAKLLESHSLLEKQREEERQSWEQKLDSLRRQAQREGNSTIHALLAAKESAEAEVKLLRSQLRMNPHRNDGQGATSWDDRLVSTPYPTDDYVISGQPERTNIPNKAFEAQAQAAIIELEQENDKLRTIIHQMRQDMEVMQRAMTQPSYHGCNDSHPIRRPRTAEPVLGESGNSQVHILQGLLKEKQSIIDRLLEQQQRLHELLEQSSKRAEQGNGRDSGTLEKALDNNRELRQKLAEAVEDMRVMTSERSRLMDMSNALKAEIRYWMEKHSNKVDATTQSMI